MEARRRSHSSSRGSSGRRRRRSSQRWINLGAAATGEPSAEPAAAWAALPRAVTHGRPPAPIETVDLAELPPAHLLLVTAVAVETEAVARLLQPVDGHKALLHAQVFDYHVLVGSFAVSASAPMTLMQVQLLGMGAAAATQALTALLPLLPVQAVLCSGVAAGIGADAAIGDVAVATSVVEASAGSGAGTRAGSRATHHYSLCPELQRAMDHVRAAASEVLGAIPIPGKDAAHVRVREGAFAVRNAVIKNAAERDATLATVPDAVALEMEGIGLAETAGLHGVRAVLLVKSIVDLADRGKNKDAQRRGALLAAWLTLQVAAALDTRSLPMSSTPYRVSTLPPARPFYGRSVETADLLDKLARASQQPVVLSGAGGCGKTSVALRSAWRLAMRGDAATALWINAERITSSVSSTLDALGVDITRLTSRQALCDALVAQIAALHEPVLLVLDNAPDAEAVAALIPPITQQHRVLITTRAPWPGAVRLGAMSLADAVLLLQETSAIALSHADAKRIAGLVACQPLLLYLIGSVMHERGPDALKQHRSAKLSLAGLLHIVFDDAPSPAQYLAAVSAMLGPDHQPTVVLLRKLAPLVDPLPRHTALRWLRKHGVVAYDGATSMAMHRDVAKVLAAWNLVPLPDLLSAMSAELEDVSYNNAAATPWVQQITQHVAHVAATTASAREPWQSTLVLVTSRAAQYLESAGQLAAALDLSNSAVERAGAVAGKQDKLYLDVLGNLGVSLVQLGRYEAALDVLQQAHQGKLAVLGDTDRSTILTLGHVAACLRHLHRFDEALPLLQRVVAMQQATFDPSDAAMLASKNELALCLSKLQRHDEALPIKRELVDLTQQLRGEDHPEYFNALTNLSATLAKLGRDAEALEVSQQSLVARQRVQSSEHPDFLAAQANTAVLAFNAGQHQLGVDMLRSSLQAQRRVLGPDHPSTRIAARSLASMESALGTLHS